jgi:uncharacterized protein YbjT (DUF2867 family)
MNRHKHALVLGASGLVGSRLLDQLLEDSEYAQVTILVRRKLPLSHPKLNQISVDYEQMPIYADAFAVDAVFCCLGTTMKKAGSKEAFRRVDLDYPVEAAKLARDRGVKQFAVISSTGAKESSPFFYSRVKGEMERLLQETGLPELHIFRPSLLLGNRSEHRPGEAAAAAISRSLPFLYSGPFRRYKPAPDRTVAAAMRAALHDGAQGRRVRIYESEQIAELGGRS